MTTQFNYMVLVCKDCKEEFVFTASAQEYFESRGRKHVPERCRFCHIESKKHRRTAGTKIQKTSPGIRPA